MILKRWGAIGVDGSWWMSCDKQCGCSAMTLYTWEQWALLQRIFPTPPHIVLWTHADDWGQSLFQWGGGWYATGTLSMHRPKPAKASRCISVKLCSDDSSHMQSQQQFQSVLSIIVYTLIPYTTTYLWSSLRSFPIPWPCSLPFHCKSSFSILFNTTYFCLITIALLIHCLVVIFQAIVSVLPIA
jgi:hypothetical protein